MLADCPALSPLLEQLGVPGGYRVASVAPAEAGTSNAQPAAKAMTQLMSHGYGLGPEAFLPPEQLVGQDQAHAGPRLQDVQAFARTVRQL